MSQDPGSGSPMSDRMQSLLSRAVEDQLSEQRQLAGALTEVRAQLARLGGQLQSMQGTSGEGSEGMAQGLAGIATDIREAVRILAERLDGVARLVQERGHDLAEQRASIDELKTAVESHTRALDGMTGGLTALGAFGERIDSLQSSLAGMHDRLRGLEELTAAVTGMQQSAEAHDTGLRELRQAFSGVAARAAQLPGRDDIDAMVGNVGESVDGISNRLGRIETSMPSLLERLDELAAALVGHRDGIAEVSEQISALGVASPTDNSSGSVERSVAVESALMSMRQQLDALHERSDATAVEELAGRLDELHEGLFGEAGLRAQVLALQPDATAPDEDERLQDAVARAVGDSERRLSEHIDQAVLALAEALLRRRSSSRARPDSFAAALATAMPATAAPVDDTLADDDDEDDDEIADQSGRADVVEATADEDTADEDTADDHEVEPPTAVAASAARPAPWQTPPSAPPAAPSAAPAESARKRKWWRPGD